MTDWGVACSTRFGSSQLSGPTSTTASAFPTSAGVSPSSGATREMPTSCATSSAVERCPTLHITIGTAPVDDDSLDAMSRVNPWRLSSDWMRLAAAWPPGMPSTATLTDPGSAAAGGLLGTTVCGSGPRPTVRTTTRPARPRWAISANTPTAARATTMTRPAAAGTRRRLGRPSTAADLPCDGLVPMFSALRPRGWLVPRWSVSARSSLVIDRPRDQTVTEQAMTATTASPTRTVCSVRFMRGILAGPVAGPRLERLFGRCSFAEAAASEAAHRGTNDARWLGTMTSGDARDAVLTLPPQDPWGLPRRSRTRR